MSQLAADLLFLIPAALAAVFMLWILWQFWNASKKP